jgi:hypothetical protein
MISDSGFLIADFSGRLLNRPIWIKRRVPRLAVAALARGPELRSG